MAAVGGAYIAGETSALALVAAALCSLIMHLFAVRQTEHARLFERKLRPLCALLQPTGCQKALPDSELLTRARAHRARNVDPAASRLWCYGE